MGREHGPKKLIVWNKFEHWQHMAGILYRPTLQALSGPEGFTIAGCPAHQGGCPGLTTHTNKHSSHLDDKVNIRQLKHIGPLGLAYLTNMYNIIPHTWKLANIIPIPKPNKYMNICTSYRPMSLLSVIAKTRRCCGCVCCI